LTFELLGLGFRAILTNILAFFFSDFVYSFDLVFRFDLKGFSSWFGRFFCRLMWFALAMRSRFSQWQLCAKTRFCLWNEISRVFGSWVF